MHKGPANTSVYALQHVVNCSDQRGVVAMGEHGEYPTARPTALVRPVQHASPQIVQVYAEKPRRGIMADQGFAKLRQNETGSKVDEPNPKGSTK